MRRLLSALVVCVALLALLAACGGSEETAEGEATAVVEATEDAPGTTGAAAQEPTTSAAEPLLLRIGFAGDLTGPYAAYEVPLLKGMEFAAEQINANEEGVQVEVVSKDYKGDQSLALTTTQELIDDGVRLFAVTVSESNIPQALLINEAGGVATLGTNSSPQVIADSGERSVMIMFPDFYQAAADAQYACDQGYKTAYTIGSPQLPYTNNTPRYFADAFAQICDGQIVGEDEYKFGQTEFGTQVTKIQRVDPAPDVIFTPMFIPDFGAFMKQLRSSGVEAPVITTDGNDTPVLVDSAGSAVDGVVYSTHGFPEDNGAMAQFFDEYTEIMGEAPESNTYEAIGRDTVYVLVEAAKNAGSAEPDAILDAVLHLSDLELVTGPFTMNPETGMPEKEVTLIKMEGTEFTLLDTVVPSYLPKE